MVLFVWFVFFLKVLWIQILDYIKGEKLVRRNFRVTEGIITSEGLLGAKRNVAKENLSAEIIGPLKSVGIR